jgi:nucleotide-binding universal stress UspA family protein
MDTQVKAYFSWQYSGKNYAAFRVSGSRHTRKHFSGEQCTRFRIKTILVPVDFSNYSREGLRCAIAFANEFGAKIILLHATYLGYIYSSEGTAIYDIPGLQKAAWKTAKRKMRELVRSVNFGAVEFETVFTEGSPAFDICAFAKDHQINLIITSTHGLTGFKHVLIGSTAEQVVRHAPCSALVVPSHPRVRAEILAKSNGATREQTGNGAATTRITKS